MKKVFLVRVFGNAPICASTVLECSCCRIDRNVAAPTFTYPDTHNAAYRLWNILH